uniref:WGS project CBME000000000 data, contig CS3487_c000987 n=1 Tax=Fusarium pseudograminearum CS3487 TaxID=1318458 RepID=A0A096PDI7_FUSPS|nr:unnamed protein product [Fusarium pseudograminearum CS3487]
MTTVTVLITVVEALPPVAEAEAAALLVAPTDAALDTTPATSPPRLGISDSILMHTSISLNKLLENDRGSFRWSAGGHHGGSSQVTVQQGDTLRGIAARFNTSFDEIARHNNITNPDLIYPGQTLSIPGGGSQGGGGFGNSARHVRLVDGGQRLEGELSRDGDWVLSSIILDERIRNFNGTLELV